MSDVRLTDNGDIPRNGAEIAADFDIVLQQAAAYITTIEGEWPFDESKGLPWIEWFTQKPAPINEIQTVIPVELERQISGISEVQDFSVELDQDTGILTIDATIIGDPQDPQVAELGIKMTPEEGNFHPVITTSITNNLRTFV